MVNKLFLICQKLLCGAFRLVRICIKKENRDKRLTKLKEVNLARKYKESRIDRSIDKARKIPRKVAMLKVKKKKM